ncbi:MAG: YccF domain-containing protein [Clostridia bacterium]|nr:YccF domain-containing protein [Clostridia bacterium]
MKLIGNLLWFIFTGLLSSIAWFLLGILWCITIIGIPFGKQCFKMAKLVLFPFGKTVKTDFGKHPIANILWLVFGGLELCVGYLVVGVIWCITIVGIPFGKQCFKLASLSLIPFGASIS